MILKVLLIGGSIVALLIGGLLIYASMQPDHSEIAREITINAPAEKIFPFVNNRTLANSWNPWILMDPDAKIAVSGPETGVGSKTSWTDGKKLGTGSATVTESVPNEKVTVRLSYQKPFEMEQDASFILKPAGNGQTNVTWMVTGKANLMCKVMGVFMNMDKMVGDTFSKGLGDLKTLAEKAA